MDHHQSRTQQFLALDLPQTLPHDHLHDASLVLQGQEDRALCRLRLLADAERKLRVKTTKKATEDVRIATAKVEWGLGKLADLRRTQPEPRDARIFPGVYAPVMIWENGHRVVKPMRYHCRPAGKPEKLDVLYPGTYNAFGASLTVRAITRRINDLAHLSFFPVR
jgi:hypothetical protein